MKHFYKPLLSKSDFDCENPNVCCLNKAGSQDLKEIVTHSYLSLDHFPQLINEQKRTKNDMISITFNLA